MIKKYGKRLRPKDRDTLHTLGPIAGGRLGCALDILESVDSTNIYVKESAKLGAPHGFVAAAQTQTHGRGRFERTWFSAPGEGLYFSTLLKVGMPVHESPRLTFVAALAVCEALRGLAGVDARIKWPNDVLIDGKKCCGILLEMCKDDKGRDCVVIGIGINVNMQSFPEGILAASLLTESGRRFPRAMVGRAVLREADALLEELAVAGFASILEKYKARSCTLGQSITVTEGDTKTHGIAAGFDDLGFLLLQTERALLRVASGNVTLRA